MSTMVEVNTARNTLTAHKESPVRSILEEKKIPYICRRGIMLEQLYVTLCSRDSSILGIKPGVSRSEVVERS